MKEFGPLYYTGDTSAQDRQAVLTTFKNSPCHNLLLMSDAGSMGLNIPEATSVIHLQTPYDYATYVQRSSRVHRLTSAKGFVSIYRFVTEDTIEERIEVVLQDRREVSESVGLLDMAEYEELGSGLDSTDESAQYLLGWDD